MKEKSLKLLQNDYFKSFECIFNSDNIIIGLLALSLNQQQIKIGNTEGSNRVLVISENEYPCCMYGAYSNAGF